MPQVTDTDSWRIVPNSVLDQDKQQDAASDWATQQRQDVAQQWGDQQRLAVQATPSTPGGGYDPSSFGQPTPDSAAGNGSVGSSPPPPSGAPAAATPPAESAGPTLSRGDFTVNEFHDHTISPSEAAFVCGPTAAYAVARAYGADVSLRQVVDLGYQSGLTSAGMGGVGNEQNLLTRLAVPSTNLGAKPDWNAVADKAQQGVPVIISTAGHYYVANNYDPATDRYFVGESGMVYRTGSAKGALNNRWMTVAEMNSQGDGINGVIVADRGPANGNAAGGEYPALPTSRGGGSTAASAPDSWQPITPTPGVTGPQQSQDSNFSYSPSDANIPLNGPQQPSGPGLTNPVTGAQFDLPGGVNLTPPKDVGEAAQRAGQDVLNRSYPSIGPGGLGLVDPRIQPMGDHGPQGSQSLSDVGDVAATGASQSGGPKTGADILKAALDDLSKYPDETAAPIRAWVEQAQKAGGSASEIGATVQRWMRENPVSEAAPATQAAPAAASPELMDQAHQAIERLNAGDQSALDDLHKIDQQLNGAGAGGPPVAPPPALPGEPPVPPTTTGAAGRPATSPIQPPGTPPMLPPVVAGAGGTAGSDLTPQAMQALREYAAAVGPNSNAALVGAQQAQRSAGQIGAGVNIGPVLGEAKAQARQVLDQKLSALGMQNDPQVVKFIRNVETPSAVPDMPILGGLQAAQNEVKGVIFPLSMFHAYTEGLYSTFSRPKGAAEFAAAFFSKSPTEAAQQTPMWLRAAQAGVTHLYDTAAFDASGVAGGLKGAGVRAGIGGVGGVSAGYAETKIGGGSDEQARQNAAVYGLLGAAGAAAAKPLISDNLWRAVQYSKVKTFDTLVSSGVEDQVAAAAVNRTFGGLNYAQMGRSQTFQDLLRLTVQAPDWGESTMRQLGSAFFGGADKGAGFSRDVMARTILGTTLATGILNMVFHGSPVADDPAHMFQVQLPSGTADKPVYVGIGPGNLQAYADLAAKVAKDPSQTLVGTYTSRGQQLRQPGDIPQFLLNREATIPAAMGDLASGGATTFGGTRAPLAAEIGSRAAPISVSSAVQAQQNKMDPKVEALLLAAGANARYGSAGQRPTQASRAQVEPGPLDFLTKLFTTGGSGRPTQLKRGG